MSRTYSNYLLFEGVLDSLAAPEAGVGIVQSMARDVMSPTVKVIEEDCGTALGTEGEITFNVEGDYVLTQTPPLTYQDIYNLLSQGKYKAKFRSTSSCISKGGVCRVCLRGSMLGEVPPLVGEYVKLVQEFNYRSERLQGTGSTKNYSLRDDYDIAKVIIEGQVAHTILPDATQVEVNTSHTFLIRYYSCDSSSLLGYLGRTFSGGLLGISPLPTPPLVIKESLYNQVLSEAQISLLEEEVTNLGNVEDRFLDYSKSIHSRLEKSLFLLFLFAVFSDIIS